MKKRGVMLVLLIVLLLLSVVSLGVDLDDERIDANVKRIVNEKQSFQMEKAANADKFTFSQNDKNLDIEMYTEESSQGLGTLAKIEKKPKKVKTKVEKKNFGIINLDRNGNVVETPLEGYESGMGFGFSFDDSLDTSYVEFEISSNEDLVNPEDLKIRYAESSGLRGNFDGQNYFTGTQWKEFDFVDMRNKNPNAIINLVKDGSNYLLQVWNATDFDPTISDVFTTDLGGTYNITQWYSGFTGIGLQDDAVAIWTFDDDGTVYDSSMNSNNGDSTSPSKSTDCKYGSECFSFDGTDDIVTISANDILSNSSYTQVTVSFWAKVSDMVNSGANTEDWLFKWGQTSRFAISTYGSKMYIYARNETQLQTQSGLSLESTDSSKWHHFTGVVDLDNSVVRYYQNGVNLGNVTFGGISLGGGSTTNDTTIGLRPDTISDESKIQCVQIWSKSLTTDNIVTLNDSASCDIDYQNPMMTWKMEEYEKLTQDSRDELDFVGSNDFDQDDSSSIPGQTNECKYSDNTCYDFDGSADHIRLLDPADGSLDFGEEDFTISTWIKPDTISGSSDFVITKGSAGSTGYSMSISSAGLIRCGIEAESGTNQHSGTASISADEWHHVACVHDRDYKVHVYLDGAPTSFNYGAGNNNSIDANEAFTLGAYSDGASLYTDGQIECVQVWSEALSQSDIININDSASCNETYHNDYFDSTQGLNGTCSNCPDYSADCKYGNACLDFDGGDDYIEVTDDSEAVGLTTFPEMSVSGWFRREDTLGSEFIVASHLSGSFNWQLESLNNDKIKFGIRNESADYDYATSTNTYQANVWSHVVGVYDGTNVKVYLDGVETVGDVSGGNIRDDDFPLWIGARSSGGNPYDLLNGTIECVQIWNEALTAADVLSLNDSTTCDETFVNDYLESTNALNGSCTNCPQTSTDCKYGNACLDFDGSDDDISIEDDNLTLNLSDKFTIGAWTYIETQESGTEEPYIFGVESLSGTVSYGMTFYESDDKIYAYVRNESTQGSSRYSITKDAWHYVAMTYGDDYINLYIDGVLRDTDPLIGPLLGNGEISRIGRRSPNNFLNGKVECVQIWSEDLSAADILSLNNSAVCNETYQNDYLESNNALNGTCSDCPQSSVSCKYGDACLDFDGVDDYVNASSNDVIDNLFDDGGTISTWIYPNSDGETNFGRVFSKYFMEVITKSEAAGAVKLQLSRNFDSNNGQWDTTATEITLNQWNHLVMVYNSSSASNDPIIYVNGVPVGLTEVMAPEGTRISDAAKNFYIGNNNGRAKTFDGIIECVQIWDKNLTGANIVSINNSGTCDETLFAPNATWKLDDTIISTWKLDDTIMSTWKLDDTIVSTWKLDPSGGETNAFYTSSGKWNGAYEFDGDDDEVNFGDLDELDFGDEDFAVSFWINSQTTRSSFDNVIIKDTNSGVSNGILLFNRIGNLYYWNGVTGLNIGAVNSDEWHHVVAMRDSSNNIISYLDGVPSTIGTDTRTFANSRDFKLGGSHDGSGTDFKGYLDEFKLFNRTLTASEVLALNDSNPVMRYSGRGDYISLGLGSGEMVSTWQNITVTCGMYNATTEVINACYDNVSVYYRASDDNDSWSGWGTTTRMGDVFVLDVPENKTYLQYKLDLYGTTDGLTPMVTRVDALNNIRPTISAASISAIANSNLTTENLTLSITGSDPENDLMKNVTTWYIDDVSIMPLNMPFEGGSDSTFTKDFSGNENNGDVDGATWSSSGGRDGMGAYSFDGVNDYIEMSDPIDFDTNDFSVSLWAKMNSFANYKPMFDNRNTTGAKLGFQLRTMDSGTIQGFFDVGASNKIVSSGGFNDDTWYHFVTTVDRDGNMVLYVDGVLNDTEDISAEVAVDMTNANNPFIGWDGTTSYFNGTVDDVQIYNRALGAEQVLAIYQNRTDLIVSQVTTANETWKACVTPTDIGLNGNGTEVCTNSILVREDVYPEVSIVYPEGTNYTTNITAMNYSFVESYPDTCWYSLNNGETNTTINCNENATSLSSSEGINTWSFYMNDSSGNENTTSVLFTKDTIYPEFDIYSPANYSNFTIDTEINYSTTDTNLQTCWWTNDTGITNNTLTCGDNITSQVWSEGTSTIVIYANDTHSNENLTSVTFIKDTAVPALEMIYPTNASTYTVTNLSLNFTVSDVSTIPEICWYANWTGQNTTISCTSNTSFMGLDCNLNNVTVYANDSVNNINVSDQIFFSIQTADETCNPTTTTSTPAAAASSGGGGGGDSSRANVGDLSESEEFGGDINLREGEDTNFEVHGESHTMTLKEIKDESVLLEFRSEPIEVEIDEGGKEQIDLDADGTEDVAVHVKTVLEYTAFISLKIIEPKDVKEEKSVVKEETEDEEGVSIVESVKNVKLNMKGVGILLGGLLLLVIVIIVVVFRRGRIGGIKKKHMMGKIKEMH